MQITLATLASATAQQVFDQVRDHLLRQGRKSHLRVGSSSCAYRSHDGLQCAAGCLIGDEEYVLTMEGRRWDGVVDDGNAPAQHAELIVVLQYIHDVYQPDGWEARLRYEARRRGLAWTVTLASLPTASAQEVFEQAAKHLLKQNEQCRSGISCAYRGPAGACAAGALLSEADAALVKAQGLNTGAGWETVVRRLGATVAHSSLITDLQFAHDTAPPPHWRDELRFVARKHRLDSSFMDLLPVTYVPVSSHETAFA